MRQQRKAADRKVADSWFPPVRRSSGQPLDHTTRQWMESRFAHDFSRVRVHADPAAAKAADALGARAFTQNGHIAFAEDEYAPHTNTGRQLLAHELAHIAGAREEHADAAASDVMLGRAPVFQHAPAPHAIQMKEKSVQERASELADKLQILIDSQEDARRTMRKEHSAPAVKRAQQRREGKLPELTGVGKIESQDRFVVAIRELQPKWAAMGPAQRAETVGAAAAAELVKAGVPAFRDVLEANVDPNLATFSASEWIFRINEKLAGKTALDDVDAQRLTNVAFHESRHAEQHFLAARFAAGQMKDAATIEAENKIHIDIAHAAVARKFDSRTAPSTAKQGAAMFQALVANRDEKDALVEAMNTSGLAVIQARVAAEAELKKLKASPSEKRIARANAAYEALLDAIHGDRASFKRYLNLPSEMDASEVGESAALAFRESGG